MNRYVFTVKLNPSDLIATEVVIHSDTPEIAQEGLQARYPTGEITNIT